MPKRLSVGRLQALMEEIVTDTLIQFNLIPTTDNGADLGSSSKHWANVYVGDLHFKNDRGSYTIVEEEEYLSIRNNKTGKLYKFVLEEIGGQE